MRPEPDVTAPAQPGVRQILVRATGVVAARVWETVRVILVVQGAVVPLGILFLAWLFPLLLELLGERSITAIDLGELLRHPVAVSVFSALLLGLALLVLAEFLVFLVVAGRRFRDDPASPPLGLELAELGHRMLHPSTLLLLPYFALLLPFGGLALGGLFTGGIRIPFPLTSELLATPVGTAVYVVLLLATIYVEARLAFTLPLFAGGMPTIGAAMKRSWQATRGQVRRILAVVACVIVVTVVMTAGLSTVGLAPTRYADNAFPEWAPAVALLSLTLVEIAVFFVVGFALALLAQIAMWAVRPHTARFDPHGPAVALRPRSRVARRLAVAGIAVVAGVAVTLSNAAGLATLSDGTATMIVSHRGEATRAIENTIGAIEDAAIARPDFVEIDVQQASDGGLVVFHDLSLRRLTGDPRRLADVPARELVQLELRQNGLSGRIPTLDEALARARELEQPLFLELKIHGHETRDYLDRLINTIYRHDARDSVRIASFNRTVVEEFALREPTIPAGLLVSLNLGRAPATSADFLIVNANSYTPALRDDAWARGLELYVWTVDDMRAVRDLMRDSVNGIITNRVFAARAEQENIRYETGIAKRLEDAIRRAFGW